MASKYADHNSSLCLERAAREIGIRSSLSVPFETSFVGWNTTYVAALYAPTEYTGILFAQLFYRALSTDLSVLYFFPRTGDDWWWAGDWRGCWTYQLPHTCCAYRDPSIRSIRWKDARYTGLSDVCVFWFLNAKSRSVFEVIDSLVRASTPGLNRVHSSLSVSMVQILEWRYHGSLKIL